MSGLGIVLEEAELPLPRPPETPGVPAAATTGAAFEKEESPAFGAEPLLPPLPQGEPFLRLILTSFASLNESPASSSHAHSHLASTDEGLNEFLSSGSYASYELDSPSLRIDAMPLQFPGEQLLPGTAVPPLPATTNSSSPLRRLKSLKKGIRKLSLLKITSLAVPSPSLEVSLGEKLEKIDKPEKLAVRPLFLPLHSSEVSLVSLNINENSGRLSLDSSSSHNGPNLLNGTNFQATQVGHHAHTSSVPSDAGSDASVSLQNSQSALSLVLGRRRTLLNPMGLAATTPPVPSPVIMLLENLTLLKKNLSDTEQSFFDNLQTSEVNLTHLREERIDSIEKLSTSDELIEYLLFLHEHKKLIEDAYDVTKDRLSHSGWCSSSDLENLSLQRDSSLSQIDTKLLKIEERLNSRFNLSMLNNASVVPKITPNRVSKTPSMSPSLKVLESRCLSFAMEMGEE